MRPADGYRAAGEISENREADGWPPPERKHSMGGYGTMRIGMKQPGAFAALIAAKWPANSPLVMVDQYVPSLKSMRAIALDVGDKDPFVSTNRQLGQALTRLDVPSSFEIYDGDHGNRVRERFESQVVPFFSRHLTAGPR